MATKVYYEEYKTIIGMYDHGSKYGDISIATGRSYHCVRSVIARYGHCASEAEFETKRLFGSTESAGVRIGKRSLMNGTIAKYIISHTDETFEDMAKACGVPVSTIKLVYNSI